MKSYNHLYETAISEETRRKAVHKVILGRKKKAKLKRYIEDEEKAVKDALRWIGEYENEYHTPRMIYDGFRRKQRTIIVPTFKELVVQHCVVEAMKPVFLKGMYEHSYASIPGRGAHLAKKVIEKWIRKDAKNCKYVLKLDIRHFFESIPHDRLKEKIRKKIHDKRLTDLVEKIIDVTDRGLPLGFSRANGFQTGICRA